MTDFFETIVENLEPKEESQFQEIAKNSKKRKIDDSDFSVIQCIEEFLETTSL